MSTENKRQLSSNLTASPKPTREIDSPYMIASEAVVYLRLRTVNALYRLIDEQRLPFGRRGRLYLFDKRKLDRWVESCGGVKD